MLRKYVDKSGAEYGFARRGSVVGVTLNGKHFGDYYAKIKAWTVGPGYVRGRAKEAARLIEELIL